jgi:hypothetical protein
MDSPAPINFQAHAGRVAQAYGVRKPGAVAIPPAIRENGKATIGADGMIRPPFAPGGNPAGAGADARQDRVTFSSPAIPEQIEQLIAGQVDSPVSRGQGFDEPPPRRTPATAGSGGAAGAYAMYTRSADRVEVATSVALGRSLDARG